MIPTASNACLNFEARFDVREVRSEAPSPFMPCNPAPCVDALQAFADRQCLAWRFYVEQCDTELGAKTSHSASFSTSSTNWRIVTLLYNEIALGGSPFPRRRHADLFGVTGLFRSLRTCGALLQPPAASSEAALERPLLLPGLLAIGLSERSGDRFETRGSSSFTGRFSALLLAFRQPLRAGR